MSVFWVNYEDGRVATRDQLAAAGLVDDDDQPVTPLASDPGPERRVDDVVRGADEAGTRRVHRHPVHSTHRRQASLEEAGWREVPIDEIGYAI